MKKYILILLVAAGLVSCGEDTLTPSGKDQPTAKENPDMSKPLIADYKNNYGVSIVYQFNTTSDFLFSFQKTANITSWNKLTVKQFTKDDVEYGLDMLQELFLCYFKDEVTFKGETIRSDFKTTHFPKGIFLVDSLAGSYSSLGQYLNEPNQFETDMYYSFLWNNYEPMIAFNKTILDKVTDLTKYRNSILYCFLSELFIDRGLYNELPESYFEAVADLYGTSVNELATTEDAPTWNYGGRTYYLPTWYMSTGFAMTNNSPANTASYTATTNYTTLLNAANSYTFPTRERDFRNMIHVMICETSVSNIQEYFKNDIFLPRMQILIEAMYRYGIDVFAINPAAEEYFK